jgi:hypothetical protein
MIRLSLFCTLLEKGAFAAEIRADMVLPFSFLDLLMVKGLTSKHALQIYRS